jgi:hypothetical protein
MNKNVRSTIVSVVVLALLLTGMPSVQSQDDSGKCEDLVMQALQMVGSSCVGLGRNEACYGHDLVVATFQAGAEVGFEASGDLAGLTDLQALVTQPADPDAGMWGIALVKVQADLSDAEDALTFVLFGDTELAASSEGSRAPSFCTLTNNGGNNINVRGGPGTGYGIVDVLPAGGEVTADGRNEAADWVHIEREGTVGWLYASLVTLDCEVDTLPVVDAETASVPRAMPAFILRSGTESLCEKAPNGLLVQSPDGQRAHVMINGVEFEFASTAYMTGIWGDALTVYGLDGTISLTAFDQTVTVLAGTQARVPLDTNGLAIGEPQGPDPYAGAALLGVPVSLLEKEVVVPSPLSEDEIAAFFVERWGFIPGTWSLDWAANELECPNDVPGRVTYEDVPGSPFEINPDGTIVYPQGFLRNLENMRWTQLTPNSFSGEARIPTEAYVHVYTVILQIISPTVIEGEFTWRTEGSSWIIVNDEPAYCPISNTFHMERVGD